LTRVLVILYRLFICILAFGCISLDGVADEIKPNQVITTFHDSLLKVMKSASSDSIRERYKKLDLAVDKAFHLSFMIRAASGTTWRKSSEKHKISLLKAFRHISVATYAFRFNGYSGQRFETLETVNGLRGMKLVDTQIISPNQNKPNKVVRLTYVTKKFSVGWKIVDVLLDGGISELSVRHSEYRSTLKTKGAGFLAKILNQKAEQLIAQ
jgi:phospholipid transport system substrate-binding protein